MKQEKGVTLISVTIYVLVVLVVVSIISVITSFYYSNIVYVGDSGKNTADYTKFNTYFLQETQKKGNRVQEIAEDGSYIIFSSGNKYTYQDNCIYQNHIRICENVTNAAFKFERYYDKNIVSVFLVIGDNAEYSKTTEYVLKQ